MTFRAFRASFCGKPLSPEGTAEVSPGLRPGLTSAKAVQFHGLFDSVALILGRTWGTRPEPMTEVGKSNPPQFADLIWTPLRFSRPCGINTHKSQFSHTLFSPSALLHVGFRRDENTRALLRIVSRRGFFCRTCRNLTPSQKPHTAKPTAAPPREPPHRRASTRREFASTVESHRAAVRSQPG
jgi:hypothetical protein